MEKVKLNNFFNLWNFHKKYPIKLSLHKNFQKQVKIVAIKLWFVTDFVSLGNQIWKFGNLADLVPQ
jgi:hypothetical protein